MASTALTLSEAALLAGRPELELAAEIAAGRLSAIRRPDGSWCIDPVDLNRRRARWDLPAADLRRGPDQVEADPLKL